MAVASLVCSIGSLLCGIGCILGIIFGFIARQQIRSSNGTQRGEGLATAGIIVGFVFLGLFIAVIIALVVAAHHQCGGLGQPAC